MKSPKILFISANNRYINLTNYLIPTVLAGMGELVCYGPGYVSKETLRGGIEKFLSVSGEIDLVVSTLVICGGGGAADIEKFASRYTVRLNKGEVNDDFLDDVRMYLRNTKQKVICYLTDLDPHSVQKHRLDYLEEHAGYYICWGNGFLSTLNNLDGFNREKYVKRKMGKYEFGLFDEFVENNIERIINIGHMVADTEFYWAGLQARSIDVSVPGVQYARRNDAVNSLRKKLGKNIGSMRYRNVFRVLERLGLKPYSNYYLTNAYNQAFQSLLFRSRICITDGGGNNYPVRKFLEIPAAGSLLVCWPAEGLEKIGFKNNVNYISIDAESDVPLLIESILNNIDEYAEIASAGRNLVLKNHSVSARTNQLTMATEKILMGTYKGSYWEDGCFVCT